MQTFHLNAVAHLQTAHCTAVASLIIVLTAALMCNRIPLMTYSPFKSQEFRQLSFTAEFTRCSGIVSSQLRKGMAQLKRQLSHQVDNDNSKDDSSLCSQCNIGISAKPRQVRLFEAKHWAYTVTGTGHCCHEYLRYNNCKLGHAKHIATCGWYAQAELECIGVHRPRRRWRLLQYNGHENCY